jgi:signal transduction histidine kinase
VQAEIENDGAPRSDRERAASGTGLSGLRERLDRMGGEIESGATSVDGEPGYRLSVRIPIGERTPQEAR